MVYIMCISDVDQGGHCEILTNSKTSLHNIVYTNKTFINYYILTT